MEGKIDVIGRWYITIETSPVNYVVRCGDGKKSNKGGWRDTPRGYFSSLRSTVKFIRDQIVAERLSEACTALPQAIRTISEVDMEFEKIIERIEA